MALAISVLLALALGIPVAARLGADRTRYGPSAAALAPACTPVAVIVAVAAGVTVHWLAVLPALPAAALVAWQLPPRRAGAGQRPAGDPVVLRVATVNVLAGRASADAIARFVREFRPGVLAVQELTARHAAALEAAGVGAVLPYTWLDPRPGSKGIGIFAAWPLADAGAVPEARSAMPRFRLDPGCPLTVTLVHPPAPVRGGERIWRHDLSRLRLALASSDGLQLVVGDFNASRDHRLFRRVLATGLRDAADVAATRRWPGLTWPANRWYPALARLDHILVPAPAVVREAATITVPGTDHRGAAAVIELRPPA